MAIRNKNLTPLVFFTISAIVIMLAMLLQIFNSQRSLFSMAMSPPPPTGTPTCSVIDSCCANGKRCTRDITGRLSCTGISCISSTGPITQPPTITPIPPCPVLGACCPNGRWCTNNSGSLRCDGSQCISYTRAPTRTATPSPIPPCQTLGSCCSNGRQCTDNSGSTLYRCDGASCTPPAACSVSLRALPSAGGTAVRYDLRATVSGGAGSIKYQFNCLRGDGTWDRTITTSTNPYTAVDLCKYTNNGYKTAAVRITRGTCVANSTVRISVGVATPTPHIDTIR